MAEEETHVEIHSGLLSRLKRPLLIFVVAAVCSMALCSVVLFAEMEKMSPIEGKGPFSSLSVLVGFDVVAAILLVPCSIIAMFFKSTRMTALIVFVVCVTFIFCAGYWIGRANDYRMAEFRKCAVKSRPLVSAIAAYQKKHGNPPEELKNLVPEFLAAVPGTGISAYPEYNYYHGKRAVEQYDGNPWVLVVDTPENMMDFSSFMFLPNQNYPDHGYGGWVERLDDWAYVHE